MRGFLTNSVSGPPRPPNMAPQWIPSRHILGRGGYMYNNRSLLMRPRSPQQSGSINPQREVHRIIPQTLQYRGFSKPVNRCMVQNPLDPYTDPKKFNQNPPVSTPTPHVNQEKPQVQSSRVESSTKQNNTQKQLEQREKRQEIKIVNPDILKETVQNKRYSQRIPFIILNVPVIDNVVGMPLNPSYYTDLRDFNQISRDFGPLPYIREEEYNVQPKIQSRKVEASASQHNRRKPIEPSETLQEVKKGYPRLNVKEHDEDAKMNQIQPIFAPLPKKLQEECQVNTDLRDLNQIPRDFGLLAYIREEECNVQPKIQSRREQETASQRNRGNPLELSETLQEVKKGYPRINVKEHDGDPKINQIQPISAPLPKLQEESQANTDLRDFSQISRDFGPLPYIREEECNVQPKIQSRIVERAVIPESSLKKSLKQQGRNKDNLNIHLKESAEHDRNADMLTKKEISRRNTEMLLKAYYTALQKFHQKSRALAPLSNNREHESEVQPLIQSSRKEGTASQQSQQSNPQKPLEERKSCQEMEKVNPHIHLNELAEYKGDPKTDLIPRVSTPPLHIRQKEPQIQTLFQQSRDDKMAIQGDSPKKKWDQRNVYQEKNKGTLPILAKVSAEHEANSNRLLREGTMQPNEKLAQEATAILPEDPIPFPIPKQEWLKKKINIHLLLGDIGMRDGDPHILLESEMYAPEEPEMLLKAQAIEEEAPLIQGETNIIQSECTYPTAVNQEEDADILLDKKLNQGSMLIDADMDQVEYPQVLPETAANGEDVDMCKFDMYSSEYTSLLSDIEETEDEDCNIPYVAEMAQSEDSHLYPEIYENEDPSMAFKTDGNQDEYPYMILEDELYEPGDPHMLLDIEMYPHLFFGPEYTQKI